jgi:AmmeMemoRadiSam system protein A
MPSAEPRPPLPTSLRALAREAIERGLATGCAPQLDVERFEPELREPGASFVTLRRRAELRGCTGTLEARLPLVEDVARNAWRSASADPRFPPLAPAELDELEISVSVLSPLEPFRVESELDLLARLRPGIDGLVLREGAHSATFLPSVWESLAEPRAFLDALRQKAGLPPGHWSGTLRFERYTTRDAP